MLWFISTVQPKLERMQNLLKKWNFKNLRPFLCLYNYILRWCCLCYIIVIGKFSRGISIDRSIVQSSFIFVEFVFFLYQQNPSYLYFAKKNNKKKTSPEPRGKREAGFPPIFFRSPLTLREYLQKTIRIIRPLSPPTLKKISLRLAHH